MNVINCEQFICLFIELKLILFFFVLFVYCSPEQPPVLPDFPNAVTIYDYVTWNSWEKTTPACGDK